MNREELGLIRHEEPTKKADGLLSTKPVQRHDEWLFPITKSSYAHYYERSCSPY